MSYHAERYQANKEKLIEGQMKYYKEHRETYIEYMRDYNKEYYQANRDRIIAKRMARTEAKPKRPPYVRKSKKKVKEVKEEIPVEVYVEVPYVRSGLLIDKGKFVLEFR